MRGARREEETKRMHQVVPELVSPMLGGMATCLLFYPLECIEARLQVSAGKISKPRFVSSSFLSPLPLHIIPSFLFRFRFRFLSFASPSPLHLFWFDTSPLVFLLSVLLSYHSLPVSSPLTSPPPPCITSDPSSVYLWSSGKWLHKWVQGHFTKVSTHLSTFVPFHYFFISFFVFFYFL